MSYLKRRNYIINRNFQFKFILYTLIPSAFCFIIFYFSLNIYFSKLVDQGVVTGLPADHPYFSLIADQKNLMQSLFLICSSFTLLFYIFWGVFISHKIAGPLYRLTKFFQESNGKAFDRKLSFRPGDFFLEIPIAINEWMVKGSHLRPSIPTPGELEVNKSEKPEM